MAATHADVLSWDDCVQLASANNNSLKSAREKLFQSETSQLSSMSSFYPQLSLSAGKQNSVQAMDTATTVADPTNQYSYGLSIRQLLFDGFKTWALADSAASDLKAAEFDYAVSEANVRYALRTAFVNLLNAQEQLVLAQIIKDRRKQNVEMIKLRYEAGREHRGSLLVAEADLAQAEADIAQAQRSIELYKRQLQKECGLADMDITSVTENTAMDTTVTHVPNFESIASGNPTLRGLIQRIDSARNNLKAAYAEYYPELSASYQTSRGGGDWVENDSSTYWSNQWSFGLNLSFTLFDGHQTWAGAAKARSLVRQTQDQMLDGKGSVTYILAQTWTALQNARDNYVVRLKYLDAAEERARIAGAQYATGLLDFNNWTIIEDALVNARKGSLNAQASLLSADANWVQAQGGGLSYVQ